MGSEGVPGPAVKLRPLARQPDRQRLCANPLGPSSPRGLSQSKSLETDPTSAGNHSLFTRPVAARENEVKSSSLRTIRYARPSWVYFAPHIHVCQARVWFGTVGLVSPALLTRRLTLSSCLPAPERCTNRPTDQQTNRPTNRPPGSLAPLAVQPQRLQLKLGARNKKEIHKSSYHHHTATQLGVRILFSVL